MTTVARPAFLNSPRAERFWLVLCLAWLAWLVTGIFPITPLEGDEQGVIQGANALATYDLHYWNLRYLYEIQPGSYVLISRLARLSGWSIEGSFAFFSAGGALLFAGLSAIFVQRVLRAPWPFVAVGFLLSQEIWAAAYYLNTTAMGGWLAMLALWFALKPVTLPRGCAIATLLAVAGWIRVDCLLLSPVVVALAWWRYRALAPVLREVVPIALLTLALVVALYFSSHISLREVLAAYEGRTDHLGWGQTARRFCLITSALVGLLSLLGLVVLVVRREWPLLLIWLAGTGLSLVVYGSSLSSNKYLYLAAPFFVLTAIYATQATIARWPTWSRAGRWTVAAATGALLVFDTVLGVLTSTPTRRLYEPRPRLATLASLPINGRTLQLTLGPGEFLATMDGYRLRGGTLFAPAAWSLDKAEVIRRLDDLAAQLRTPGDASVLVGDWLGYQLALRVLRQDGFEHVGEGDVSQSYPYAGRWSLGSKTVHLTYAPYVGSVYFDSRVVTPNPTGARTWYVGVLGDLGPLPELNDARHWQLHSPDRYGYIRVHQRL